MACSNLKIKPAPLRLSDIGTLPTRMLAPIEGYEDTPLVTLEEAVKPLMGIVPKVARNVYLVKKNCLAPADGLSSDESAAIMLYTFESLPHENSLYIKLNETLRSETRQKLVPWFLYLRLLLTALGRLPSERRTVNRGVNGNIWNEYNRGDTVIWWGFSSCTVRVDVLENQQFFGKTGERTLFQIECKTAKNIKNHSFVPTEEELLLLPARQLRVVATLDSGHGLHIVQLEELEPEYELIELVSVPYSLTEVHRGSSITPKCLLTSKTSIIAKQQMSTKSISDEAKYSIIPDFPSNTRWSPNGITVAGGNGCGDGTNQLNRPYGFSIDDDQTLVIADFQNHRIVQWKKGDTAGQVVAGGNGRGNQLDQFNFPTDVLIEKETDSLIICDRDNRRVVRWSRHSSTTQGEVLIDKIDCFGLGMDHHGYLYVSDYKKHEVRRYRIGSTNGTLVAGGHGTGDGLDQLNNPAFIFVDRNQTVYVSDESNHRVMKWNKNAKEGIVVAGGQGAGSALTQLAYPYGVAVDNSNTVYVTDSFNHRVLRYPPGEKRRTVIVGPDSEGSPTSQFYFPTYIAFDHNMNLYVVDTFHHRVQRFSIE